jgi:hypothetical protein
MKKIKILGFGLIAVMIIMMVNSCQTKFEDPAGQRGLAVAPSLTDVQPAVFDVNNLNTTYVQFKVDVDGSVPVSQAVIQVSYNGGMQRVDFTTISSFPATVRVKLTDAVQKLGMTMADVQKGDVFTVEVVTETNGEWYRSNAAINPSVVCAYNQSFITGSYHAVSTDWGSEGDITITPDPNDEYVVYVSGLEEMEGLVEDKGPLKMVINNDFSVTVDRQVLASDLSPWGLSYTNLAYGGSGKLNTCDGSYQMNFEISVDQGSWGLNAFTFTKN